MLSVKPNPRVPYTLRYQDDAVLVVEKPAGVVTEPGKGHAHDSLLNGLFDRFGNLLQNLGEQRDWGLLHRLDKDTSGLLLVAIRNRAYDALRAQFEAHQVKKVYWAIVLGGPKPAQGVVQKPIVEATGRIKRAVLQRGGAPAVTAYRVLQVGKAGQAVSLVEARPKTGRLHQVRVHLASLGCPILGDSIYGDAPALPRVPRLCLHAARLSFVHPANGRRMEISSPWPSDLEATSSRFGLQAP